MKGLNLEASVYFLEELLTFHSCILCYKAIYCLGLETFLS